MALFNTINFLPTVFRTVTNQRFLGATLDQLVTDAVNEPINGYIGRKFSPTYKAGDNYVPEMSSGRINYQLEASVVVTDGNQNIKFNAGYLDLLNSISTNNGLINNHSRLFSSDSYNYDGKFDYDKFVNYYNYYWLPNGPTSVSVSANETPYRADYTVTRNSAIGGYVFSGLGTHPNLPLTLARGGTYKFEVNQPGANFWIQTEPGVSGADSNVPTITTRQVFGVRNNGTDVGTILINVPQSNGQDFYTGMPIVASVDAAVTLKYTDIQNQLLSGFLARFPTGLDGVNNQLQNKTFIFINNDINDADWDTPGIFDQFGFDNLGGSFDPGTEIPVSARTGVWQINLVPNGSGDFRIQIRPTLTVTTQQKIFVTSGKTYASNQFWLNTNAQFNPVPVITAPLDYLYYQDSSNPDFVGVIKIVDNVSAPIDVTKDINGKIGYTSPNGVIFTNGLKIKFDDSVTPSTYANNEYYVEGVGTNIKLVPVSQLVVPEHFGQDIDTVADYITINRASQDLNAWTRYNRWFHKDVILASANYNKTLADYGPNISGRRPIIEFDPNLQLINHGQQAASSITYITFDSTDAFVDIEGKITYTLDGHTLANGDRVVFANDYDTTVTNKIWQVQIQNINSANYITLVETTDDPILSGQNFLVTGGVNAGKSYFYNGSWFTNGSPNLCQVKTTVNQAPLFDLVDTNGYSFSDTTVYPSSNFAGTKIFSYSTGTGANDSILGFPLVYQNFNNIGDIVFTNYYDTDTFTYIDNQALTTVDCNSGYFAKNNGLNNVTKLNNWIENVEKTGQFQIFTKFYEGLILSINGVETAFVQLDVLPTAQATVPHIKVYLNNQLLKPTTDYQLTTYGIYYIVTLTTLPAIGDKIDVAVFSDTPSEIAYYEIPSNLDYNALNENFDVITLGQIRNHYNKLIENTTVSSTGAIPLQDHHLRAQGGTLIQHSSPAIYAMTFLNDSTVNFINGLNLAKKEYSKFKNKFLSLCTKSTAIDYKDPVSGVDTILKSINSLKNSSFPWYYSDMVPQGTNNSITYNVLNARQTQYEINSIFDNTILSNRAVLVYVNGVQQTVNIDYYFSKVTPAIIFNKTFTVGDVIVINDYTNTDGNYIPETPTKLGLYPKYTPEIYVDNTYQTPISVIRGHDGSITPAFGDFRDQYLLELELRIYNNIKTDYTANQIDIYDVIPGRFRTSKYSLNEYNYVMAQNFLGWVGANNVDYTDNPGLDINNPWTWNYGSFPDIIDKSNLQGFWRSVYSYWFDTDTPNITPWEMIGYSSEPSWWSSRYGSAPYTSGNLLLWEDLEAGYNWNNGSPFTDARFARPGLTKFIPVDAGGNLLDPMAIPLVKESNISSVGNKFRVGQQGPAETAWRRSSDYAFAIQLTLALTKPAEYFATQVDTSRFKINPVTGQFANSNNQRISPNLLVVNGSTANGVIQRTSGYLNWIADGIKNLGMDPVATISSYFTNLTVQLNYKVGGFTDQRMLTVSAEQTSPGSTSGSVIIPDTNYKVYLNKSVPVSTAVYSAVIVEKTDNGYSVSGYDPTNPFFTIIPSIASNRATPLTLNGTTVQIYHDNAKTTQVIPYGTEFATVQQTADFLTSYQRYLVSQGFVFNQFNTDLNVQQNWTLSIQELIYWSQQGWATGTILVLNPTSTQLELNTVGRVVDEITNTGNGNKLLDQNFTPIKSNNFNILRVDDPQTNNTFLINTLDATTIAYARLNLVQYEHVLVFDNVDDFGDIVYIPSQGTRQYRLKLSGAKTGGWVGSISAPGYIYSNSDIQQWNSGVDYKLGDLVVYNNFYYTASQDIPASTTFNSILWTRINKEDIQTGLLPSFGLNAQEFENFYDVDNPPQDSTFQEFSAGLIGFRQRSYLTDLGISVPTQTKFYQGYIKQKGTQNAIDALTKANFNNVNGNVNVYEEWAFQTGVYGGINSNQFREFVLDQSVFTTNPVAFTVGETYNNGNIIVDLTLANLYNASNLLSTTTTIYNNRRDTVYAADLPSVGYVNLNDVDYTQYDITKPDLNVTNVGAGDKLWVAKNSVGEWDIYRINETKLVTTTLSYTLDTYAQLHFTNKHSFKAGDVLILKYFNSNYDGVYDVISAPNPTSVTISISDVITSTGLNAISPLQQLIRALTISGTGTVYKLDSARYTTIDEVANTTTPTDGWINNDQVWVDQATDNGWGVYTYVQPWLNTNNSALVANTITANAYFGHSTRISSDAKKVYVGAPGNKQVQIFSNVNGTYQLTVTINNSDSGYGTSIETQGNLVAIGAPIASNVHVHWQTTATGSASFTGVISGNVLIVDTTGFTGTVSIGQVVTGSGVAPATVITGFISGTNGGPGTYYVNQTQAVTTTMTSSASNIYQVLQSANAFGVFGSSISMSADRHWLYVGEQHTGVVQAYWTQGTEYDFSYTHVGAFGPNAGNFGQAVKTNADGSTIVVGAPTASVSSTQSGNVCVYTRSGNAFTLSQTINSTTNNTTARETLFGSSLAIDSTATNLFIGIPGSLESGYDNGSVERYVLTGSTYEFNELIAHPFGDIGAFGTSVSVSGDANVLAVGSIGSPSREDTTFDKTLLIIDSDTTKFVDYVANSGATYLFEPLINQAVINDLGQYVFIQELETQVVAGEQFGSSVDVTRGVIAVGAPGYNKNKGAAYIFENPTSSTAWNITRSQQPTVDINSISRTIVYNKSNNNILAALDYIDPAKGKVLNAVDIDIDYKLAVDPALYNAGTGNTIEDLHWGPTQVGTVWWNLDTVRYINYEQDELIYRLNHWGEVFPGSSIDVYQWVESSVPPSQYVANGGLGTPLHEDDSAYSTYGYVTPSNNVLNVKYYFWVSKLTTIQDGKQNSVYSIAEAIANPQSQGITYATVLRDDTIAMYNVDKLLVGKNSVVQLGSRNATSTEEANLVHSEYALIQEGNPKSLPPLSIATKLIDSLAGVDQAGNPLPDPALVPSQAYGIQIRPRQSMLMNRELALTNFLNLVNPLLLAYPVVERKVLTLLNSSESVPNPNSGTYNVAVSTYEELGYIDTNGANPVPNGYAVLVNSDSTQNSKWAVYTWNSTTKVWVLTMVQSYKTNLYWSYANWYTTGYDPTKIPDVVVANNLELGKLKLVAGTFVKVLDNGSGNFVVYEIDSSLNKNLVGIQNGTVQINTSTIPSMELRQILLALSTEVFIDDLALEYNIIFFTLIKYILTEQKNIDWAFKTSFLSATQSIRKLQEFPSYIPDNQDFYKEYINEVKPYRTTVREFVVDYIGNDTYGSDVTDFDLPPYWDANLQVYRSPNGEQTYDSALLSISNNAYSQWYNNYKYEVVGVTIDNPGTGYLLPPSVVITGDGGTGAAGYAEINSTGGISAIVITNPGTGFTGIPTIVINGVGTGAQARAVLKNIADGNNSGHNLVRSISTTIKFDRTTYTNSNTFVFWDSVTTANIGETIPMDTIIVLNDNLYQLDNAYTVNANVDFPIANVSQINSAMFDNANDRIVAYNGNINLKASAEGMEYPGVTIDGNTYVGSTFDTLISSQYTDVLGISPSEIIIDGGAYYDTYNSHAPEELIPGRMFDSLNFQVYDTQHIAFRTFEDMSGNYSFYRISNEFSTTLSEDLLLTDNTIHVVDALKLPPANPALALPGVVFINGEKLTYWRNYAWEAQTPWTSNTVFATDTLVSYSGNVYLTTGNAFGPTFSVVLGLHAVEEIDINSITNIRRATDGTAPSLIHPAGSDVVDTSAQQLIPYTSTGTVTLSSNVTYQVVDPSTISYGITLTGNITANVGDILNQVNSNNQIIVGSMRVLQNVVNSNAVAVSILNGTPGTGFPELFDDALGMDPVGDDVGFRITSQTPPTQRPGDTLAVWTPYTYFAQEAIFYSGNVYSVTGSVYGSSFTTPSVQANVKYNPVLTAEFGGNTTITSLALQVNDQWWNSTTDTLYYWSGSNWLPYITLNPGVGFDNATDAIYINGNAQTGTSTGIYVTSAYILGQISSNVSLGEFGQYTVPTQTTLNTGTTWYNKGITTATNGQGIFNSTTPQAIFLKESGV